MIDWNALTREISHRPWPLPRNSWVMTMSWSDLLFAHWSFEPAEIRALVPEPLELDTYEGRAYIGVVPFRMSGVGPRGLGWLPEELPAPRAFPELNVRTYVRHEGKPGVWFLSLDAASRLAVWGARTLFHLPYYRAVMRARRRGDRVEYFSRRQDRRLGGGVFAGSYEPIGEPYVAEPGSLDHWLTERYCLYAALPLGPRSPHRSRPVRIWRGEIHHRPWPLCAAAAEIEANTVAEAHGLIFHGAASGRREPLLHFVDRIDVVAWWPVETTGERATSFPEEGKRLGK